MAPLTGSPYFLTWRRKSSVLSQGANTFPHQRPSHLLSKLHPRRWAEWGVGGKASGAPGFGAGVSWVRQRWGLYLGEQPRDTKWRNERTYILRLKPAPYAEKTGGRRPQQGRVGRRESLGREVAPGRAETRQRLQTSWTLLWGPCAEGRHSCPHAQLLPFTHGGEPRHFISSPGLSRWKHCED